MFKLLFIKKNNQYIKTPKNLYLLYIFNWNTNIHIWYLMSPWKLFTDDRFLSKNQELWNLSFMIKSREEDFGRKIAPQIFFCFFPAEAASFGSDGTAPSYTNRHTNVAGKAVLNWNVISSSSRTTGVMLCTCYYTYLILGLYFLTHVT